MVYSYNGIYAASENEWTLAIHIQELNLINIVLSGNNEKIPHKVQDSLNILKPEELKKILLIQHVSEKNKQTGMVNTKFRMLVMSGVLARVWESKEPTGGCICNGLLC